MSDLQATLLSDGPSDRALIPVLKWLPRENGVKQPIQVAWADLRSLPKPPSSLDERIVKAIELFPCDLLFVHRDAEGVSRKTRTSEILVSTRKANLSKGESRFPISVPVVPVRMTEAWFLIDVGALRRAAGNPNGQVVLQLPPETDLEGVADPKTKLQQLLQEASELRGRRLKKFNHAASVVRLADEITSYMPLRGLQAFNELESLIRKAVQAQKWSQ